VHRYRFSMFFVYCEVGLSRYRDVYLNLRISVNKMIIYVWVVFTQWQF